MPKGMAYLRMDLRSLSRGLWSSVSHTNRFGSAGAAHLHSLTSDKALSVNGARLRVLADIQVIGLLLEARRPRLAAAIIARLLVQPRGCHF
jgi:hypothetical protein